NPANALSGVKITTLPTAGTLQLNGATFTPGTLISKAALDAGQLTFRAAANANGQAYATFTFQVKDTGGTAYAGVDLDPTAKTMTIDVTTVNDAPAGADNTVTALEDSTYTFLTSAFPVTLPFDNPANALSGVKITTLPAAGTLKVNGSELTAGDMVTRA